MRQGLTQLYHLVRRARWEMRVNIPGETTVNIVIPPGETVFNIVISPGETRINIVIPGF